MIFSTLLLFALTAQAQTLIHHSFESDEHGWSVMGGGGAVRMAKDRPSQRDGANSLAVDYQYGKDLSVAVLPVEISLEKMKAIRFWVKTDIATAVAVFLSEKKPGGDYSTYFWSPKDTWQQVTLVPSDFTVNDGPNDPKDPNGKLDLDQIQGIGVLDLKSIFSKAMGSQQLPFPLDAAPGSHTLLLNDFQVVTDGPAPVAAGGMVTIDDFKRPVARWLSLGGMEISVKPGDKPALEASYKQVPGQIALLTHRLADLDLSKCERLNFEISSKVYAQIVVSIEMAKVDGKGARYKYVLEVDGGGKPLSVSIAAADFVLDENSPPDAAGKFEFGRARTISILDVTGVQGAETLANTLWVSGVQGVWGR